MTKTNSISRCKLEDSGALEERDELNAHVVARSLNDMPNTRLIVQHISSDQTSSHGHINLFRQSHVGFTNTNRGQRYLVVHRMPNDIKPMSPI